jgi:hypothetical protein
MSAKRFGSLGLRCLPASNRCFVFISLLLMLLSISCVIGEAQSDPVVARHMGAFFEAFLERKLSGTELREVTDEFIKFHTGYGKNRAAIHERAQTFGSYVKILREHKGSPAEFTLSHVRIELNYFQPSMQNTTFLRLLTEPDPVRVVGPLTKRLMTERDVVALFNLHNFSTSEGDPQHKELSRQQIESLVVELDRAIGTHPKSVRMPQFCTEAAALWAGIRQEWPRLSAEEKRKVRAYAGKGIEAYMPPPEMYARLLGLNATGAFSRYMDDFRAVTLMIFEMNLMTSFWSRASQGLQ